MAGINSNKGLQTGLRMRALTNLLLALILSTLDMTASASNPRRVRVIDIGHKPTAVHDKADGWAEYPSLAVSGDHAFLAYSMSEGERSGVYYCAIDRRTGSVGPKHRIDEGHRSAFRPSICTMGTNDLWLAWTSYDHSSWRIRGALVNGDRSGSVREGDYLTIYGDDGFSSQVRVGAGASQAWFVWISWLDNDYRVLARPVIGSELLDVLTIYHASNPVGRPEILVIDDDHIVVAWDEYVEDRFTIRLRELESGKLGPVRDISTRTYANEWQPSMSRAGGDIMVAWHRVPGTTNRCEPALTIAAGSEPMDGVDRPDDDETWRVKCMGTPDGHNVIAWATRRGYRRTQLYLRAATGNGLGKAVKIQFPMRKIFINWFDCSCDGRLALTYEHSGSLYYYDVEMPHLAGLPVKDSAADDTKARQDRVDEVQNQLSSINYPSGPAAGYDEGYADETPYEQSGGLRDSRPKPRSGVSYSAEYRGEMLNVYFGDYHNHTSFSDGRAFPDMLYLLARDIRGLDFMCVSDHDGTLTPGEFSWNCAVCDNLTREGEYVCLPGYEENKGWARNGYGHWNVLLESAAPVFHYQDGMTPSDLFKYAKERRAIVIPHHIGVSWAPYNWDHFDLGAEPVVEICSVHGIYENLETCADERKCVEGSMLVDGLDRGYRFGIVGGSDLHNCFSALNMEHSITGVYAENLTRRHILNAMRKKRTFAATGHMIVVDFRCNGKFMGESVNASRPLHFTARLIANEPFTKVEIVGNGDVVYRQDVNSSELSLEYDVEHPEADSYYYLKATTASDEYAWSSPIFVAP